MEAVVIVVSLCCSMYGDGDTSVLNTGRGHGMEWRCGGGGSGGASSACDNWHW